MAYFARGTCKSTHPQVIAGVGALDQRLVLSQGRILASHGGGNTSLEGELMLGIQIFSAEGIAVKASLSLVFETIAPLQAALGVSRAQAENLLGLHLYFTPELSVQTAVVLL